MKTSFLPKSEFGQNVLTLMNGTVVSQAIPIIISPILTRLYTPEDFGVFTLFLAIVAILGSISCARYELAVMLPKTDEDAINLVAISFVITLIMSFCIFLLVFFLNDHLVLLLKNKAFAIVLYFIPIAVFLAGCFNVLNYFNNRKKNYKAIANANVTKSVCEAIVQLILGFFTKGSVGLITGQVFSRIVANLRLLKHTFKVRSIIPKISKTQMLIMAKRYINFPKFTMWASLANVLSLYLTSMLIPFFYGVTILGYYAVVQRVLGVPSTLIGNSVGQVFFQQATIEKHETGCAIKTFNTVVKKLLMIGLPIFGLLYFTVDDLFPLVFGSHWKVASEYAQIVLPLFFVRFVVSTVSHLNTVFEKNKNGLYIQLILMFSVVIVFVIADTYCLSIINMLQLHTYVLMFDFLLLFIYLYLLANGRFNTDSESGL